jgi:SAM-dependent methyltransferase
MKPSYLIRDQQLMAEARNYFAWQASLVMCEVGCRVVEVGCGLGNFTELLRQGRAVLAFEIEPACVEVFQSRYESDDDLRVLNRDWCATDWHDSTLPEITAFRPDSCVCINVLEHLEDDREALQRMAAVLPSGGSIVLLVPAFPALYGPIDKQLGHYRRYTRKSVRRLADGVGLQIKSARYMNSVGLVGWWVNAHILRREAQSAGQTRVFDRFVVPVLSRMERLVPPPFGQSLLVVLRKPVQPR